MMETTEANQVIAGPGGGDNRWGEKEDWNPDAFEERLAGTATDEKAAWSGDSSSKKQVKRFQDLSLATSEHAPKEEEDENKSWPYERSPCRLFGGKNTKPGHEEANKELFNTNFEAKKEFEEGAFGTVNEDESISSSSSSSKQHDRRKAMQKAKSYRVVRSSHLRRTDSQSGGLGSVDEEEGDGGDAIPKRSVRKHKSADSLKAKDEEKTIRSKQSTRRSKEGLESKTYHGDECYTGSSEGPRSSSRHRSRRATDDDDPTGAGRPMTRKDDLSAATLHGTGGKSAVSRIRSKRNLTKEKSERRLRSSSKDRRGRMTRAMSTENVKMPEQYGPSRSGGGSSTTTTTTSSDKKRRGRRRYERTSSQRSLGSTASSKGGTSDEDSFADVSKRSDDDSHGRSRRSCMRREGSRRDMRSAMARQQSMRRQSSRRVISEPPRRDLLDLLREEKTVKARDFLDKDNRRLLHFILYEHKMEVSLKEMVAKVEEDLATNAEAALLRAPLPLYVATE